MSFKRGRLLMNGKKFEPTMNKTDDKCRLSKVVIPAAGLGTRMLPFTKEQPKELLPIYSTNPTGQICVKPTIQMIFEQLYDVGFKDFCFIVGRDKRAIQDHFTINHSLLELTNNDSSKTTGIDDFYEKIEQSRIAWLDQFRPEGFGHAVFLSESFLNNNEFLVHAGDVSIISLHKKSVLDRIKRFYYSNDLDIALVVKRIDEIGSLKQHGIVVPGAKYEEGFTVKRVIEKPAVPPSNLAIMPIYIFKPIIFEALKQTSTDQRGELQLTDAIQTVIENDGNVGALMLREDDIRLDIGTPESYLDALTYSYKFSQSYNTTQRKQLLLLR